LPNRQPERKSQKITPTHHEHETKWEIPARLSGICPRPTNQGLLGFRRSHITFPYRPRKSLGYVTELAAPYEKISNHSYTGVICIMQQATQWKYVERTGSSQAVS
jgi:hypothetical protein